MTVSAGPQAGPGVSKTLPPVKDIHVTGIVNVGVQVSGAPKYQTLSSNKDG